MPPCPARLATVALSLGLLAGCGGGDGIILPRDGEPADIAVVAGNNQRGPVGEPLSDSLVVQVTDARGRPVEGATVAFDFASAGAGAAVVPEEKTTNGDGLADARLVLGINRGQQTGQAWVVLAEGREPIQASFSAMALPENANSMAAVAGQDQAGHVGLPLDDRLVVEVIDGFGNPVAGVPISWAAAGGGSVSEAVVETDEDGRSRVDRTLGPTVGQQTTLASSEGLAGSPVIFLHTALSGDASRLVIVSGSDQTAEAGTRLPADLVVRLVDSEGNGVSNTAVTWVMATGGGTPSPQNTTTDSEGRTSAQWTLGQALGEQRVDAVVSGVGVASFRATATSGAPASLFIRTQPPASARNGVPLSRQPVIQLRDPQGNDVSQAGVEVTAAIGSGGGELGGTRQVITDAAGRATFTDLSISGGPGSRTLIFTAPGYAQVTSTQIALEAIGTSTSFTGDTPDPTGVGAAFTVSFLVGSQGPTPTGSVTVSDGVQSCSGTLVNGAGSCQLALTTVGQRTLTATYAGEPGLLGSSATEVHTVMAAPPPPPAATATTITADTPDPSVGGSTFTVSFQVTSGGTPTGSVTVSANNGPSCTGTLSGGSGSCQLTLNNPGDRTLTATYSGGSGFSGSLDTEPHRVDQRPPDNEAPSADFNWHCEDLTCSFTDNSEDDDGTITNRSWDFGDGSPVSNELNPSHTYAVEDDYRVVLTVTDNGGLTDQAEDIVDPRAPPPQVLQIDQQPSGNALVGQAFNRQPRIQLRAGGDDVERPGVTVSVAIASGGGALGGNPTAATDGNGLAEFENLSISGDEGPRTLVFSADGFASVTSNSIDARKADSDINIDSDDPDPSAVGVPVRVVFSLTGQGGDPTGTVTVTAANGTESCGAPVAQGFCDIILTAPGDRDLTATYSGDGTFNVSSDTEPHTVSQPNQSPVASFTFSCLDLTCSFNAIGSSDLGGTVESYAWDFGDGTPQTTESGATTSHPYAPSAVPYNVKLIVIDNDGAPSPPVTQSVTVTEPPPLPPPAGE